MNDACCGSLNCVRFGPLRRKSVEYRVLIFDEPLRFDLLVDDCLLVELKAVEILHPSSSAAFQLREVVGYSMRIADQLANAFAVNFHESILKNGIFRMILPGANKTEGTGGTDVSL
jgi:hypothetical protein